jgi:toxin YhaV
MPQAPFDVRNGWALFLYPAFQTVYDGLVTEVARLAAENPADYTAHPKTKLLARINTLILDEIPADPGHKDYRQGTKLGREHKNWFRAKFLKNRFRLFFRFDSVQKVIIYCWVNDENTLRKDGARTDPYAVFAKMIKSGNPPNGWDDLAAQVNGAAGKRAS